MATIISLFNHKGGVSKTTTTFNLGWALAEQGKKVLMIDGDPQCNLTGTVLGFAGHEDISDFYEKSDSSDIYKCLEPVFSGSNSPLASAIPCATNLDNLMLLPGHIEFAENETQLSVAISTSSSIRAIQNLPGSLRKLIEVTCIKHDIDIALVDMSPSVGAINQCFLMGSDYFIVPTSPDFYCKQAIYSLSRVIPRWHSEIEPFRDRKIDLRFDAPPKFMGIISQRYRPREGSPAKSFQRWIDEINLTVDNELIPILKGIDMIIHKDVFKKHVKSERPYNMVNISDFNSLIAQSQLHHTPVFALSDAQLERQGVVLQNMQASRDNFRNLFTVLAEAVIGIVEE